jgi:sugar phosphate isomerase/epimerase
MISPETDPIGASIAESLAAIGFDYVELSLSHMACLDQPDFLALARTVERSGLVCEACNNFFPASIRLTGPAADLAAAVSYAQGAIERAASLGARIIVFGSPAAKNVPAGFPHQAAWRQLLGLLRALGPVAERHGVVIAVEHHNKRESNIVTLAAEALDLVREVDHPNVQLLADHYHLVREAEDPGVLIEAGSAVRHVHFAEGAARLFPTRKTDEHVRLFDCLKAIRYAGRCSIEAYTTSFETDARRGLLLLRDLAEALRQG